MRPSTERRRRFIAVIQDQDTGRSRGFVEMSSKEEGDAAIQQFDGHEVGGRPPKINEAKPREDRGGGSGGNHFDSGNRGDYGRGSRF